MNRPLLVGLVFGAILTGCSSSAATPSGSSSPSPGLALFTGDLRGPAPITGLDGPRHCLLSDSGAYDGSFAATIGGVVYRIQIDIPAFDGAHEYPVARASEVQRAALATPIARMASMVVQREDADPVSGTMWVSTGGRVVISTNQPSGTVDAELIAITATGKLLGGSLHLSGDWSCS